MSSIKSIESPVQEKQKTWRKSVRTDDLTHSIDVEELTNGGYLVEISKDYKDKKGEWKYDRNKFYSQVNPLSDDKEAKEKEEVKNKSTAELFDLITKGHTSNLLP
jgi:ABC-type xylose transport system substrate-binding protein